jgi:hypothetical protein
LTSDGREQPKGSLLTFRVITPNDLTALSDLLEAREALIAAVAGNMPTPTKNFS